jgi:hypothetical protein
MIGSVPAISSFREAVATERALSPGQTAHPSRTATVSVVQFHPEVAQVVPIQATDDQPPLEQARPDQADPDQAWPDQDATPAAEVVQPLPVSCLPIHLVPFHAVWRELAQAQVPLSNGPQIVFSPRSSIRCPRCGSNRGRLRECPCRRRQATSASSPARGPAWWPRCQRSCRRCQRRPSAAASTRSSSAAP